MTLHCNTFRHPLKHNGTQQRDRLLVSLIPDQLKLDERSIGDLIAFAGKLSSHVRYSDNTNAEAGDWLPFWESDTTSLLAIIASLDPETFRVGYRSAEIDYYALKKKEEGDVPPKEGRTSSAVVDDLVGDPGFGVYGLAAAILAICNKIPGAHPLKQEIFNIISSSLQEPLKQLIRFHKAVDPDAIKKYSGFIGAGNCSSAWGLPDNASFECIDFMMPYESVNGLWKLFLLFYKSLKIILGKVKKAFQSALRSRHDHQPQITLFIAFLHLFQYLQDDLNNLNARHLLYYYHDVLRLEKRRIIPDKVHIVFGIAANLVRHRIARGTMLKAGQDAAGNPMSYEMESELVISRAVLVERQNLYVQEAADKSNLTKAVALKAADKRDGYEEEWTDGSKAWHPLSGMAVSNRLEYKIRKLSRIRNQLDGKVLPVSLTDELQKYQSSIEKLNAFSGFSISSTELWLNKGFSRIISLDFTFANPEVQSLLEVFGVEISTTAGLIRLKPYVAELENNAPPEDTGIPESAEILTQSVLGVRREAGSEDDPFFETHNRIARVKGTQRYIVFLDSVFPSVLSTEDGRPPFLRFTAAQSFRANFSSINSISLYSYIKGSLSPLKRSRPGILFRAGADGAEQSGDELVIADTNEQTTLIRIPQIFAKKAAFLELSGPFSGQAFSILINDQWKMVPADKKIPDFLFNEPDELPAAPDHFNFNPLAHNPDGWIKFVFKLGAGEKAPQVFDAADVFITYRSAPVTIPPGGGNGRVSRRHYLSYFTSLGDWIARDSDRLALRAAPLLEQPSLKESLGAGMMDPAKIKPKQPANGNLFLGFENITPDQTLSLLFKTAEGTGNPDHYAPAVVWSYLKDDRWIGLPPQFILADSTLGLRQTGIILFQIPVDINNGNTWIKGKDGRTDLYWLRASATESPDDSVLVDALPMLKDIFVNAAEAEFKDDNNTEDHLDNGIAAGVISALRFSDVGVKSVVQPFASFDGRRSENADVNGYLRRIHERLRHKHRAVTVWDYERLILEAFPEVTVVKCLPHTRRLYTARPGHVTLAAIPYPGHMTGNLAYYPVFSAGDLAEMKSFLVRRNSYFVGRYGDPEFCCCEDGCACEHSDRLDVINARFEPIRLKVCVRFYRGRDIPFYTKELNEALKAFLAPWARESKPLLFGVPVSITRLLQFLENLDYVDVVMGLQVKHFASRQMAEEYEENVDWSNADEIIPHTAGSVFTTYLDKLNEDNPNVIDHVINVIDTYEKCSCKGCEDKTPPPDPHAAVVEELRNTLHDLWSQHPDIAQALKNFVAVLNQQVDNNVLQGDKIANPENGQQGVNAYAIKKMKSGNRIMALAVGLSFDIGKPFTVFNVNNPNN